MENGADAIYFGLDRFNARMRAANFTEADLPALMAYLHRRGARGYVSFNTLVFTDELVEAERFLRSCIAAGVDAAIVQDIGICRLIRRISSDFPIHASTQMTVTSAAGVAFARELGCRRVVLARECTLEDIARIQSAQRAHPSEARLGEMQPAPGVRADCAVSGAAGASGPVASPLPLEIFVHGALCVAYSGQCLTSEALGGRSANRGECAQACRLPYTLVADGREVPLGDRRYLLSPHDLAGVDLLDELRGLGVHSLKIEGRLKSPEYVAMIVRVYREALDQLEPDRARCEPARAAAFDARSAPDGKAGARSSPDRALRQYEMEMAFSRGLGPGWLRGIDHQRLVHARFGKKRGVFLGEVLRIERDRVVLRLRAPIKPGDGIVFDAGHPDQPEQGGRVYSVERRGESAALGFGRGDIDFRRLHLGDRVWKTNDPELDHRVRASFSGETPRFQRPLTIEARGELGAPLTLIVRDELGREARVDSAMPLAAAQRQPLTTERLRAQLGRLGGTAFRLGAIDNRLAPDLILPLAELNRLRREAIARLEAERARPPRWSLEAEEPAACHELHSRPAWRDESAASCSVKGGNQGRLIPPCGAAAEPFMVPAPTELLNVNASDEPYTLTPARSRRTGEAGAQAPGQGDLAGLNAQERNAASELIVLVRTMKQLEAALASGVSTVYCEFESLSRCRAAVACARSQQSRLRSVRSRIYAVPPRITKPGEEWMLELVGGCGADGYLVRNYDQLEFFARERCVGDYSLNVANPLSAQYLKERFGLERLTVSYDLNNRQIEALLEAAPPDWFEINVHQRMPMFHMEHCVFCAFLTSGTDHTNCGRPCDRRVLALRDRVGAEHPVKADAGCRNTVFNALAQTGAEYVAQFQALGARRFRIEFLDESPEVVARTIGMYRRLLAGEIGGAALVRELKLQHQLGVTRGSLDKGERPTTVL